MRRRPRPEPLIEFIEGCTTLRLLCLTCKHERPHTREAALRIFGPQATCFEIARRAERSRACEGGKCHVIVEVSGRPDNP